MSAKSLILSAVALALLRIALILWGGQQEAPNGDQLAFHSGAQKLIHSSSEWFKGEGEFGYRAPMYFVYLSAALAVTPHPTFQTSQIATALIGVINCILMFLLIRSLTGDAGAKSGFWLRGLLPSYVIADTFVMSEPLFSTFLLSALVIISLKPNKADNNQVFLLGFFVACCLLTREIAIAYPIVFVGYLVRAAGLRQEGTRHVGLFALAMVITLTPWMWRNAIVWGQVLPISYTSGVNLHIGNNQQATGKWMRFSDESIDTSLAFGTPQSDTWHRKEALRFIKDDPFHFIRMGFKKVAWFLWPRFEREETKELYKLPDAQAGWLSFLCGVLSALVMILGIAGIIYGSHNWFWWVSVTLITYTIVVTFVVFGSPRFRDPIDHLLIVFAVSLITRWRCLLADLGIKGSPVRRRLWILVPVLSYLLANWAWVAHQLTKSGH